MQIEKGLMPYQVLQRNSRGQGSANVSGVADSSLSGDLSVTIQYKGKILKGFNGKIVGTSSRGAWNGVIKGIPTGGPYTVIFRLGASVKIKLEGILVGDVWFLGGQSNMQGVGNVEDALPSHTLIHAFYNWDEWDVAKEPLTFFAGAVDPAVSP